MKTSDWFKKRKAAIYSVRLIPLLVLFVVALSINVAFADVWIPEDEYLGYFDSQGVYTVVGAVKNTENYPVAPTITIMLNAGGPVEIEQHLPVVFPNKDIPFKIPLPQITGDVILEKPLVSFEQVNQLPSSVEVVYDKSLRRHPDGHLTGKIINNGNTTEYGLKVYATIHGQGNVFLDVGKNIEYIEKIEPGQIIDFTMYPESSIASDIKYYSCFAIGDETVIPLYAMRNGERFNFRYDSTASFTVEGFDQTGTALSIAGINSFKVPTFVNFEFPMTSEHEKFDVTVNEKPVRFIQSIDEEGNWHVAFDVDGASQNKILIRGFDNPAKKNQFADVGVSESEDYSYLLYVVLVAVAAGAIVYLYKQKKRTLQAS